MRIFRWCCKQPKPILFLCIMRSFYFVLLLCLVGAFLLFWMANIKAHNWLSTFKRHVLLTMVSNNELWFLLINLFSLCLAIFTFLAHLNKCYSTFQDTVNSFKGGEPMGKRLARDFGSLSKSQKITNVLANFITNYQGIRD